MLPFKNLLIALKIFSRKKLILIFLALTIVTIFLLSIYYQENGGLKNNLAKFASNETSLRKQLTASSEELNNLKNQDQYKINKNLEEEIKNIQNVYKKETTVYEKILDLKSMNQKTDKLDEQYAKSLKLLSERNYASADGILVDLEKQIQSQKDKLATSFKVPENLPVNNAPPASGFRRQQVAVGSDNFMVDIISADLNSTKVIVDTASDSDCGNNCPVLSLGDYVARNGAFAGINGSYFCPATYPSCANKTNSFDTLLMNKNKKYFNSDNNVYSTVPAVIFSGNSARFVSQSLDWGRDTGVDAVIANYPLLVLNNQVVYSGSGDSKLTGKGPRCFIGATGNTVYIGIVYNANMGDAANAIKTLGINSALNLDEGGSTALWFGGYKAGPGRNIPNAVLFVKR